MSAMEKGKRELSNIQVAEIERLIDEFKEKFKTRTSDADNFITIHEIESMWGELQQSTLNVYSDMVSDLMGSIDEGELIRKKKGSTRKRG
jgi:Ca2+-binding EF-hand superfamily protein